MKDYNLESNPTDNSVERKNSDDSISSLKDLGEYILSSIFNGNNED